MGEVAVAVALKLVPAMVTALCVWEVEREHEGGWPQAEACLASREHTSPPERGPNPRSLWGEINPLPGPIPQPPLCPPTFSPPSSHIHFFSLLQEEIQLEDHYTHSLLFQL